MQKTSRSVLEDPVLSRWWDEQRSMNRQIVDFFFYQNQQFDLKKLVCFDFSGTSVVRVRVTETITNTVYGIWSQSKGGVVQ